MELQFTHVDKNLRLNREQNRLMAWGFGAKTSRKQSRLKSIKKKNDVERSNRDDIEAEKSCLVNLTRLNPL